MVYTVGYHETYIQAIQESKEGYVNKTGRLEPGVNEHHPDGYRGGIIFESYEDAHRYLTDIAVKEFDITGYAVFGVEADWRHDVAPALDGWWGWLLTHSKIVVLPETKPL